MKPRVQFFVNASAIGGNEKIKALITQAKRGHKCFTHTHTQALPFTCAPSVIASFQKDTEETRAKLRDDSYSWETAAYYIKLKIIPIYIPQWIMHRELSKDGTTDIFEHQDFQTGIFSQIPHILQPERARDGSSAMHPGPQMPLE